MLHGWRYTIVSSCKDQCRTVDLLGCSRCRWVCLGRRKTRYDGNRCVILHGKHRRPATHRMTHNGGCSGDFTVEDISARSARLLKCAYNICQVTTEVGVIWCKSGFCFWQGNNISLRNQRRPYILIGSYCHYKSMAEDYHWELTSRNRSIASCCCCRIIDIRFNCPVRAGGIVEGNSGGTNCEVLGLNSCAKQNKKE